MRGDFGPFFVWYLIYVGFCVFFVIVESSLFSSFFVGVCVVFCSRLRVRDHDETFGIRREMLLEPHTRLEIEMIRRLVKQQHLQ